jgi:hypothetical protein
VTPRPPDQPAAGTLAERTTVDIDQVHAAPARMGQAGMDKLRQALYGDPRGHVGERPE